MIKVRKIQFDDNPKLAQIIRTAFEEFGAPQTGTVFSDPTTDDLFSLFQKQGSVLWVAEYQHRVVGCCGIYPTEGLPIGYVELVKFYISREARGLGIGKLLMEYSTQSAIDLKYTHLYLESLPAFSKAINIYLKQGYYRIDQPLGNSGHVSCDVWMVKPLTK